MITKLNPKDTSTSDSGVAYNKRRNNYYKVTSQDMNSGQSLLDSRLEKEVAPLVAINGVKFITLPRDGNPQNDNLDNILVSGIGSKQGLDEESAMRGDILRVEFDPDERVFSYLYVKNGVEIELRYSDFYVLRRKVADLPGSVGLRNLNFLLTPAEYLRFFNDFRQGFVRFDAKNVDICSYKDEQITKKTHYEVKK